LVHDNGCAGLIAVEFVSDGRQLKLPADDNYSSLLEKN
jgi:hypothetical protein